MAIRLRSAMVTGGPNGESAWYDAGGAFTIQNHGTISVTTGGISFPVDILPKVSTALAGGSTQQDTLATGAAMQRLEGFQICANATLSAATNLSMYLSVYRAAAQLGTAGMFGWLTSGTGTPAFTANTVVSAPALTNTSLTTIGSYSYCLLQPSDVLVLTLITSSSSVTFPVSIFNTLIV